MSTGTVEITVDEVFDDHRPLLVRLMDKVDRGSTDLGRFAPVLAILETYAEEITAADRIAWQPTVGFAAGIDPEVKEIGFVVVDAMAS